MRKHYCFAITLVLLVLVVPVSTLAHLTFFEGEVFRRYLGPNLVISFGDFMEFGIVNNEQPDWGKKLEGWNGLFAAPPELGGEDWSFEYPYIIPPGEIDLAITPTGYLKKGDVDVLKYVAAEWEEFCIMLNCIVPLCAQYENFYPVIGILGPGVPNDDEFPFPYPEDCQGCGFKRVHPLRAKPGERPGGYGPPGVEADSWFPSNGLYYMIEFEQDTLYMHLQGPGSFYIVIYDPEGKPGDYMAMSGWDECETHYTPEEIYLQKWMNYYLDDLKWTRINCKEPAKYGPVTMDAMIPNPPPCGFPGCPPGE